MHGVSTNEATHPASADQRDTSTTRSSARATRARARPRVRIVAPEYREASTGFGYAKLMSRLTDAVVNDADARVVLHVEPAQYLWPLNDRTNVALTMWEAADVQIADVPGLQAMDAIITPTTFCRDVFAPYVSCPIHVVPLGVDEKEFPYQAHKRPERGIEVKADHAGILHTRRAAEPWVFLWCASPDPRKGWAFLIELWGRVFAQRPDMLLYLKTTSAYESEQRAWSKGNVIYDTRRLDLAQYSRLFHQAHAFIYPSMGEGFGFTVAEAMSAGCPVIATSVTGHADFVNPGTARIIETRRLRLAATDATLSTAEDGLYGIEQPRGDSMLRAILDVMQDYERAKVRARRARDLIRNRFTWERFRSGIADALFACGAEEE